MVAIAGVAATVLLVRPEVPFRRDVQSIGTASSRVAASEPTELETSPSGTDDVWTVRPWPGESPPRSVLASINGKVTHGDRLQLRFVAGRCGVANLFTTFYAIPTHGIEESVAALGDRFVGVILDGRSTHGKIIHVAPSMSGVRALIDLGLGHDGADEDGPRRQARGHVVLGGRRAWGRTRPAVGVLRRQEQCLGVVRSLGRLARSGGDVPGVARGARLASRARAGDHHDDGELLAAVSDAGLAGVARRPPRGAPAEPGRCME